MSQRKWLARPEVLAAFIAGASIVVAMITAFATVRATGTSLNSAAADAQRVNDEARRLEATLRTVQMPVGSIAASVLTPVAFAQAASDASTFDPQRSLWAPADGREVSGSRYQAILGRQRVPDLRGLFLRGANLGRTDVAKDPDGDREAGVSVQEGATAMPHVAFTLSAGGAHTHGVPSTGGAEGWGRAKEGGGGDRGLGTSSNGEHTHQVLGGDVETRPRNVAVVYFIRIN